MISSKANWRITAALIVLSLIPSIAGVVRVAGLAMGAEITPDNARFFAEPLPVVLHIISAIIFCMLGAFQFNTEFRNRRPRWHRRAGWVLIPSGILAGLSGMWMAQLYPLYPHMQDHILYAVRMVVGSAMVLSLALGFVFILRKNITRHRAWVIRGYALGQGAGTQALIGVPLFLILGEPSDTFRTWLLVAGWVINIIVAEWVIRRVR